MLNNFPNPPPDHESTLRDDGVPKGFHSGTSVGDGTRGVRARRLFFVLGFASAGGPAMSVQPFGKPCKISTQSGFSVPVTSSVKSWSSLMLW